MPSSHSSFFSHYSHSKGQVCQTAESPATQANHPERSWAAEAKCMAESCRVCNWSLLQWGQATGSRAHSHSYCTAPERNPDPTRSAVPDCQRVIHPVQSSKLLVEGHHWATGVGTTPSKEASFGNVGFYLGNCLCCVWGPCTGLCIFAVTQKRPFSPKGPAKTVKGMGLNIWAEIPSRWD